jgi:predicted metal-dependent phosphoesterase TrpH
VDITGTGVPPLNTFIDLHLHSTASDGAEAPADVARLAAERGLVAIALTDHDSVSGLPAAQLAADAHGVRLIGGCEFSVAVTWGEMHLLGYFLPVADPRLDLYLEECRADRERRARGMVHKLRSLGVEITDEQVMAEADGGAVGRPHVARALVRIGAVANVNAAFDKYLGRSRPAFVEKALPPFAEVAALVHALGGIVSAAHLKDRGTRTNLRLLRDQGLDAIETRHPSHDGEMRARLTDIAAELGLGRSGGSDWHGDGPAGYGHSEMGSQEVPMDWLEALEARRPVAA